MVVAHEAIPDIQSVDTYSRSDMLEHDGARHLRHKDTLKTTTPFAQMRCDAVCPPCRVLVLRKLFLESDAVPPYDSVIFVPAANCEKPGPAHAAIFLGSNNVGGTPLGTSSGPYGGRRKLCPGLIR